MTRYLTKFAEGLARAQHRQPWAFVIVTGLITVAATLLALDLGLSSSQEAMLPQDSPEVRTINEIREKTGGSRQLIVVIQGGTADERLAFGRRLAPQLRELPGVRDADIEFPVEFFRDRGLWLLDVDTLAQVVDVSERADRVFSDGGDPRILALLGGQIADLMEAEQGALPASRVMTSRDGNSTFLSVVPAVSLEDLPRGRRLMHDIDAAVASLAPAATGLDVRLAGLLPIYQEQHGTISRDLRNASIIALVLGIIIVAAFMRRAIAPLLIGAALLPGIAWTFALVRLVQPQITMITGFLIAVLIGLGIDHGVHLLVRFKQELAEADGRATRAVFIRFLTATLPPALTSALTTAATFFCFAFAQFPGFVEFGCVAGAGIILTLISTLLILPPLLRLTATSHPAPAPRPTAPRAPTARRWLPVAAAVVVLFVSLAAYGVAHLSDIRFRNDFRELRGSSQATDLSDYVNESLGTGFTPAVFVVSSLDDAQRLALQAREAAATEPTAAEGPRFGRILASSDLVPHRIEEHQALMERLRRVLDNAAIQEAVSSEGGELAAGFEQVRRMAATEPWSYAEVPATFRRRFTTVDESEYLMLIWPSSRIDADFMKAQWERQLRDLSATAAATGIDHTMADEMLVAGWVSQLVQSDGKRVLPLVVAAVFLILLCDLRRVKASLLVMAPLAVGVLGFFAAAHALGLDFNLFNMIVIPCVIGIGIDASIHIYHRYRTEGPGSIFLVMRRTGVAVTLATLTTAVGFGSSLACHLRGLQSLGLAAIIGIAMTFAATFLFFPALLLVVEAVTRRPEPLCPIQVSHSRPRTSV